MEEMQEALKGNVPSRYKTKAKLLTEPLYIQKTKYQLVLRTLVHILEHTTNSNALSLKIWLELIICSNLTLATIKTAYSCLCHALVYI
jgi:hypothetical protein